MENTLLSMMVVAAVSGIGMISAANAVDGTITFTGNITADSCTVAVNGGASSATVDLGNVSTSDFTTVGDVSTVKDFTLNLTACSAGVTNVSVVFDGQGDTADSTTFKNNDSGANAANGVGVRLYNNGGGSTAQIAPHGVSAVYVPVGGAVDIPFSARMASTADAVKAGTLTATADYTINYQ
ncbi:fimbrial protein [Hafnia alvei]|uniref:Fimbrial protein n=1 Tax=Hafnia alvei ATCC 51873 TaxID=1002364 RepID=G9YB53_HAFAL|nr:fimbrial protein [Hafnia alvei]AJR00393.1 Fimbrial protein [Enterobacteriaceae bacterium bta3-1]EHM39493.1 fimbrial protein [Hafnia alvei ATCC 51873]QQE43805.1 type 1 fimbrial protein [Hafnia alvei]